MHACAMAIDIGASGGRHIVGQLSNGQLTLKQVYRFDNGASMRDGLLCWDLDALYSHILKGLSAAKEQGLTPQTVGIDTWAVDYVLLDAEFKRIGPMVAYRDARTRRAAETMDFNALYQRTGIARQPFNTIYQLSCEMPERLSRARHFLMAPDYFHYLLTSVAANEYTNASTTAMLNPHLKTWDGEVLKRLPVSPALFSHAPLMPGTVLGSFNEKTKQVVGYDAQVIIPATHDTGSAFMAVPARDENAVFLSSGTWSLLGVELESPILSPKARDMGFTNEGGYGGSIRFLRNIMGLWMLQCVRKELSNAYTFAQMADMALKGGGYPYTVDATDNRFLAPLSMISEVKAALKEQGAPLPRDLPELLACLNRSLAKCYRHAIEDLENITGRRYSSLNIVGGGSQNRVLCQWTADETGLPVYAGPVEGTALGNLLCQFIARGEIASLKEARSLVRRDFSCTTYTKAI